jgi:hypothetical protein
MPAKESGMSLSIYLRSGKRRRLVSSATANRIAKTEYNFSRKPIWLHLKVKV